MQLPELCDLYELISQGRKHSLSRRQALSFRKAALTADVGFTKVAFDTRRIDQETDFNPRRGLQYYHRSESFLSQAMGQKLISLAKLRDVLVSLHDKYGRQAEWQDSNARVLLSTLDKGLRTMRKDGDYSDSRQSVGSLDYIEQLLHVRYRLGFDDLRKLGHAELESVILSKDEELINRGVNQALHITKQDVGTQTYDTLMEKLFGNLRADARHPEIERTVVITIKDKFVKGE